MSVEAMPEFTPQAAKLWASIPSKARRLLLSNVWCGHCRGEVTITDFKGVVRKGDLLLEGRCSECQGEVARVIEAA